MAATSESEITKGLEEVDDKLKLRIREVQGFTNATNNINKLCEARMQVQIAINLLLQVKW